MKKVLPAMMIAALVLTLDFDANAQTTQPDTSATESKGISDAESSEIQLLRQQLNAQKAINEQLRKRLQSLEQLSAKSDQAEAAKLTSLDANAPKPPTEPESAERTTAIEQTLISKDLVLLPAGSYRLTPSLSWAHNGSGPTREDSYGFGLGLQAGLPWGMMGTLQVPYIDTSYTYGSNSGVGDASVSLSKQLTGESPSTPSLIASIGYTDNNGKDPFTPVPIGSGFRSVGATLAAVKRSDPVVLFGNLSYSHAFDRSATYTNLDGSVAFNGRVSPGDTYGIGMGVSLAATPEISLDTGFSLSFSDGMHFERASGTNFDSPRTTAGYFNLGTGILLSKNLFLYVRGFAGVTKDARDSIFSVTLPYRF